MIDSPSSESSRLLNFDFARQVYDTHQAVIRQLDTKAGVMIGVLTLLLAGLVPLTKDAASKLDFSGKCGIADSAFVVAGFLLILSFLRTAWCVQNVIIPRHGADKPAPGLMYAAQILQLSKAQFQEALIDKSSEELLAELGDNIYQLSKIEGEKMAALTSAHWPIILSLVFWSLTSVLALYLSI
jgi:hypothetical protein